MTTLLVERYARVPLYVDVVLVTEENMAQVADWCGGIVKEAKNGKPFIKVNVMRPISDRQTMAYVGDRVLSTDQGYKVYTPKAFELGFLPAPVTV